MTDSGPSGPSPAGGRVRITSPHSTAATHVPSTVEQEIDESTGVGEVYMQSLIRSQWRAAVTVAVTLMLTVVSLPIVFWLMPSLAQARVLGVPLPWLILGFGVYVTILVLGWLYVRHAERAERLFAVLVESRETGS